MRCSKEGRFLEYSQVFPDIQLLQEVCWLPWKRSQCLSSTGKAVNSTAEHPHSLDIHIFLIIITIIDTVIAIIVIKMFGAT